jgi:hypothetical protein
MNAIALHPLPSPRAFELRFRSLFDEGRGFAFPCDAAGRVELERLSERARHNFQRALALIGRDFATPALQPVA